MRRRIYFFIGTTAELIKLAPVIKEAKNRNIKFKVISSGQGELLSGELSNYLGNFNVEISFKKKSKKSSVLMFAFWALRTLLTSLYSLRREFEGLNKDNSYFIIHGDTISSLLGAIIATRYGLKLVHVESGLRSYNFLEPFPEEISRYIVSRLADIHFCPNSWSTDNLRKFGGEKVNTFQNTLIEVFWWAMRQKSQWVKQKFSRKKYYVLIMHRQEHVIFGKKRSFEIIKYILKNSVVGLDCVLMTYATTLDFLNASNLDFAGKNRKVHLTPRLGYSDFINLMFGSEYICTDGGSIQEEMYYMGKPCLLLRNFTERTEGLGENVLLSKLNNNKMKYFLKNYKKYRRNKVAAKNRPSKMIIDYLMS